MLGLVSSINLSIYLFLSLDILIWAIPQTGQLIFLY